MLDVQGPFQSETESRCWILWAYGIYKGYFEHRIVLIRIYSHERYLQGGYMINDIVLTSRVSHHKNIGKLLGCCLEVPRPAVVYEYPVGGKSLDDLICKHEKFEPLQWKSKVRIARDIAGVLVYLHTALPTPIIYRNLTPDNIVVDRSGVAKFFDFSLCITLPPGKTEQKHLVQGAIGFRDPEYERSGIVTTKSDVYSFGVFLLVLLTGQKSRVEKGNLAQVVADVNTRLGEGRPKKVVGPILLSNDSRGDTTEYVQLQAFLELTERCILKKREDRPEMLDVAKELKRIERLSNYTA